MSWRSATVGAFDLAPLSGEAPDLAARLDEIRRTRAALSAIIELRDGDLTGTLSTCARLAREWEGLLAQARAVPSFRDPYQPPSITDLCNAARDGHVVIINVSGYRCDAIAISSTDVEVIPLPRLTEADAYRMVERLLTLTNYLPSANPDDPTDIHDGLVTILDWAWICIAEPVLNALGCNEPGPRDAHLPRLWWCPTGPLVFLPIHAAAPARPDPPGDLGVMSRVVSSYTTTVATLQQARRGGSEPERPRILAVGMPTTPPFAGRQLAPLPAVADELDAIAGIIRVQTRLERGRTPVTRHAVIEALAEHDWVHFACHGQVDGWRPWLSGLIVEDGAVTVREISRTYRRRTAQFAYISSCFGAFGSTRLLDEGIHIAGALQAAGFSQVVAALFPISDRKSVEVASSIYVHLVRDGLPQPSLVARALHSAVLDLRRQAPTRPELWLPYVHFGV